MKRAAHGVVALLSSACVAWGSAGCVIATEPNEYPALPVERPTIVESAVVPSNQRVLGVFPSELLVPVRVVDATQEFEWRMFLDFDPLTPNIDEGVLGGGTSRPSAEDTDPNSEFYGIRRLRIAVTAPLDTTSCHTIQLQVGTSFERNGSRAINSGSPLERDQITWFYSPSGDFAGCPMQSPEVGTDDP